MSVFGSVYSQAYDALYGAKDYDRECAMIEALASIKSPATILDLGCGTGGHALCLARNSYRMVGVDLSSEMLAIARAKAMAVGLEDKIEWIAGDIRAIDLDRTFDAAVMMFAVLGYQKSDDDVRAALRSVARHLDKDGPFIFDVWFGPGVMADPPGTRRRVVDTSTGQIVRTTESMMDPDAPLCTVNFHLENFLEGKLTSEARESHMMRYFFPDELRRFAAETGFFCEQLLDFADLRLPASEQSWNAIAVFRKAV